TAFTATQSGNWNDSATWGGAIPPITISSTDTVIIPDLLITIPSGVTVNNAGTIQMTGFGTQIINSGEFTNTGTINLDQFDIGSGEIITSGTFTNSGTINGGESGTLEINSGTFINSGNVDITFDGIFSNSGTLDNSGYFGFGINTSNDGIIINSGTLFNNGEFTNSGTITNQCGGIINNSVTITGNPVINQPCITSGRMTGIGVLDSNTKFVFDVKSNGTAIKGGIQYVDKTGKILLQSVSITSFNVNSDGIHGTFSGTAKVNGNSGFTFTVTVEDNGNLGNNDKFSITINELSYTKSGTLSIGNIVVHR
ncbi:MAG TPA: post-COAP-1 domain-containing protein, partial [Nitrosopumilaceae archaeon]|nr:post-COAP-1 domain-containing protein [Nitrosopumilaceae archaeon]